MNFCAISFNGKVGVEEKAKKKFFMKIHFPKREQEYKKKLQNFYFSHNSLIATEQFSTTVEKKNCTQKV